MKVEDQQIGLVELYFLYLQGKGVMTTYWLLGENREDKSEICDKDDEYRGGVDIHTVNHDEGIDDIDEVTSPTRVTFHVSDHDSDTAAIENMVKFVNYTEDAENGVVRS